jgi:hypothetical protein
MLFPIIFFFLFFSFLFFSFLFFSFLLPKQCIVDGKKMEDGQTLAFSHISFVFGGWDHATQTSTKEVASESGNQVYRYNSDLGV